LAKGLELPASFLLVAPEDDDLDAVMEVVGQLPAYEVVKLRRELTKVLKDAEKATAKGKRLRKPVGPSTMTNKT